jgi:hypothetical protein
MTLRQRTPRKHDARHLDFVRSQPCCVCRKAPQSEAAHIRMPCPARGKPPTGMQQKPDDKWTVPLCAGHHRNGQFAQHRMVEADFWRGIRLDPFAIALTLWNASGAAGREDANTNRTRKRKPKPRTKDRVRPRRTIAGRRFNGAPIPSRRISQ